MKSSIFGSPRAAAAVDLLSGRQSCWWVGLLAAGHNKPLPACLSVCRSVVMYVILLLRAMDTDRWVIICRRRSPPVRVCVSTTECQRRPGRHFRRAGSRLSGKGRRKLRAQRRRRPVCHSEKHSKPGQLSVCACLLPNHPPACLPVCLPLYVPVLFWFVDSIGCC